MDTELDKKEELIDKINILSASDIHKLKIFIAGMEAERTILECEKIRNCLNQ